jgi:hypothetical protein
MQALDSLSLPEMPLPRWNSGVLQWFTPTALWTSHCHGKLHCTLCSTTEEIWCSQPAKLNVEHRLWCTTPVHATEDSGAFFYTFPRFVCFSVKPLVLTSPVTSEGNMLHPENQPSAGTVPKLRWAFRWPLWTVLVLQKIAHREHLSNPCQMYRTHVEIFHKRTDISL